MRAVCPECGSAIGGTSHALDAGNQPVQMYVYIANNYNY